MRASTGVILLTYISSYSLKQHSSIKVAIKRPVPLVVKNVCYHCLFVALKISFSFVNFVVEKKHPLASNPRGLKISFNFVYFVVEKKHPLASNRRGLKNFVLLRIFRGRKKKHPLASNRHGLKISFNFVYFVVVKKTSISLEPSWP